MTTHYQQGYVGDARIPNTESTYPDGCQPSASQWSGQNHGGLEVAPNPNIGLELNHRYDDIQVDQERMHQWLEHDPSKPTYVSQIHEGQNGGNTTSKDNALRTFDGQKTICGLRRKMFCWVLAIVAFIIIGATVGGGVGGYYAAHNQSTNTSGGVQTTFDTSPVYMNSSMAAVQWTDEDTTSHYRVYFQYQDGKIIESAWDSNHQQWSVSVITDESAQIQRGTPIAVAVGYPHANTSVPLVRNVYFTDTNDTVWERESPYKDQAGVWGNENLSGHYSTSKSSSLLAFWYQNFDAASQKLVVLFQELGANSLSIGKYTSKGTNDNPWVSVQQNIAIQDGSVLAAAPVGSRQDLRLYVGDPSGTMKQYQYDLMSDLISEEASTIYTLAPHTPFCVSTQDNRNYYTTTTLPECAEDAQLTHLLIFATADRSSLNLISWNCSSGFTDQQIQIAPLLKPDRVYLGLSSTLNSLSATNQRVYVLFDGGDGPEIEEWQVPEVSDNAKWKVLGSVPVKPPP